MKVLFVANHKGFSKFNVPFMTWFKKRGWQVDNASPGIEVGDVDNQFDICITRTPFSWKNIKAYKQLKKIIENGRYDIIHLHTPMGGVIGRLASIKARKIGTKVIYTAHGFHFFKGASLLNWLLYFPVEKLLSKITDTLVTINNEDYIFAKRQKLAKTIYHIDGVGVNLEKFKPVDITTRNELRTKFNLRSDDFVVLYTAQFIKRKNHTFILKSLPEIVRRIPNFKLILAGDGSTIDECKNLVRKLKLEKVVSFLGGRTDIPDLCAMSDVHLSSSKQEGLAISNVEAMASGCVLVLSNIRGHIEVCEHGLNGFLFELSNSNQMIDELEEICQNVELRKSMSDRGITMASKFSTSQAVESMAIIYKKVQTS